MFFPIVKAFWLYYTAVFISHITLMWDFNPVYLARSAALPQVCRTQINIFKVKLYPFVNE